MPGFNKNFIAVSRNVWAFIKKIQTEEEYAGIKKKIAWNFNANDIPFELRHVPRIVRR